MMRFTLTRELDLPAAAAWDLLADYARDAEWRAEVTSMVPTPTGPVQAGTRTEEVARSFGSTYTTPGEVVEVVDGRWFSWRASSSSLDASGRRAVEPLGSGRCRVVLDYDLRLRGAGRVATPLLGRVFRRTAKANLDRLAEVLEREQVA